MTNFERIKAKSIQEFAKWFADTSPCECCVQGNGMSRRACTGVTCTLNIKKWLEQEAEDKANISDIVQAGKSIQAIANDIAQKMGMCDLPEGVKFEPKGKRLSKRLCFRCPLSSSRARFAAQQSLNLAGERTKTEKKFSRRIASNAERKRLIFLPKRTL